jgi:hypothetical protein
VRYPQAEQDRRRRIGDAQHHGVTDGLHLPPDAGRQLDTHRAGELRDERSRLFVAVRLGQRREPRDVREDEGCRDGPAVGRCSHRASRNVASDRFGRPSPGPLRLLEAGFDTAGPGIINAVGRLSPASPTLLIGAAIVAAVLLAACGEDREPDAPAVGRASVARDPGPIHVHGLGVNPKDGALFIATHTGLFRAPPDDLKATRVANRFQDTMGFTVVGPDHFLGSGHPDLREKLPPFLGLIESRDAGKVWRPVSRLGASDFHVLEAAGRRVYGYGSNFKTRAPEFLTSSDGGRSWRTLEPPAELISLAIDPADPRRIVASGDDQLFGSPDAGATWKRLQGAPGLLGWPEPQALYVVTLEGAVLQSAAGGRSWATTGQVGAQPAAFEADGANDLYLARHDGTVLRSTDGGRKWVVRSRP